MDQAIPIEQPSAETSPDSSTRNGCIAVTGASGFVGRRVVCALLEKGYRVRALVRSEEKGQRLRSLLPDLSDRLTLCRGALSDPDALRSFVSGSNACVHLVGIIRPSRRQSFQQVHVDGTRAIVEACVQQNPGMRMVHMSALGAGPDRNVAYFDTKHRAEMIVTQSTLRTTIVAPSLILGPGGEFLEMIVDWARGKAPPYLFMPYFSRWKSQGFGFEPPRVSPVFVEDVARVITESVGLDRSIGNRYEIGGSQTLSFPEMLTTIASMLTPRPRRRAAIGIPWRAAVVHARLASLVGLGGLLPFDEGMAIMGARDSVADNRPLIEDFGFSPAAFEVSLRSYADQL